MNYLKSVICNLFCLVMIYLLNYVGRRNRFWGLFKMQSEADMTVVNCLVTLLFIISCVAFGFFYYKAAKERRSCFTPLNQRTLLSYFKKSLAFLLTGYLVVIAISIFKSIYGLIGSNPGFFCLTDVIISALLYAALYWVYIIRFQPKNVYFKLKAL